MRKRPSPGGLGLTKAEFRTSSGSTAGRVQAFLDAIPANFEPDGDTVHSVREVLSRRRAHCIEGAMVAACALWVHGEPPLLVDFEAVQDYDHVVTVFAATGAGARSRRRTTCRRYRDPVPFPARARDELLPRVREPARREDAAHLLARPRPALDRPEVWVTNQLLGSGRAAGRLRHYPLLAKPDERCARATA
jgi:hypothetical protein